jgi:hypothetical protein
VTLGSEAEAIKWFDGDQNIVAHKKRLRGAMEDCEAPSLVSEINAELGFSEDSAFFACLGLSAK